MTMIAMSINYHDAWCSQSCFWDTQPLMVCHCGDTHTKKTKPDEVHLFLPYAGFMIIMCLNNNKQCKCLDET